MLSAVEPTPVSVLAANPVKCVGSGGRMSVPFYQVDAFTDQAFAGNPAGVCVLEKAADEA
jgi:hypothetical protein